MVDSELGDIPKGWKVNPIESLTEKMNSGGTPSTRRDDYYDGNIKWFSTKELKDSYLFESERMISQAGLDNSSAKVFPVNTVLMAIYAAPTVGRLGILTEEATFNQAALGFIAKEEVGFEYVFLLLKHLRYDLNNLANGAAQQNLNVGLVKNFNIVHPTYDLLSSFRQIVTPLFLSIKINQEETNTLKFTRDNLLPKLISGELEINEISN
jgi:type I restriction enzyme S subunit